MAVNEKERDDITFEIANHIGVISVYPTGWKKEINVVSWNGASKKIDIRDWDVDHERMSRGVTFHPDEAKKVRELLNSIDIDKITKGDS